MADVFRLATGTVVDILKRGGVGVLPNDTIYGLVASVYEQRAVERVYKIKRRDKDKPVIVLIDTQKRLHEFGIDVSDKVDRLLRKVWPGPISIIFNDIGNGWKHIHRGTGGIAFRIPKSSTLRQLLKKVGPIIAPSANLQKQPYAKNISEARAYFGDMVDFYVDTGSHTGESSIIIEIHRS